MAWFNDVQKDQNVVRLLIDMRNQTGMSQDLQLLKLILHLAPGIPPVWRGETIELSNILAYANRALKGEEEAAYWLDNLHRYRVLEVYAAAGNRQAADLVKRWHHALDLFDEAWKTKLAIITAKSAARDPDEIADFDQLMYGRDDFNRPDLVNLHARLLAMSYDNSWAERLRKRMVAELLGLSAKCTWINDLGDPLQMDAASLLVLEALLPEAKKSVAHQLKKIERDRKEMDREFAALRDELRAVQINIREAASASFATPAVCDELKASLDAYLELVATIHASGRTDQDWVDFKKQALRPKIFANMMVNELEKLERHRAITSGWLGMQTAGFAALAIFILPVVVPGIRLWLFLFILVVVVWRLLPDYLMMRSILQLGEAF